MSFFSVFIIGIGLSMDAFAVSLAKGFCLKKDILKYAFKISFLFGLFQAIMPLIGWFAGTYFENSIKSIDHWIAFILLSFLGGKMIIESIKEFKANDEDELIKCDRDTLSLKSLIVLAIATSIDALAVGISFGFLSVSILPSILIIGITTFILCFIAVVIGKKLGESLQKYSELIGGIILLIIGIKILIEHLI